jgi:hypothetical protein
VQLASLALARWLLLLLCGVSVYFSFPLLLTDRALEILVLSE